MNHGGLIFQMQVSTPKEFTPLCVDSDLWNHLLQECNSRSLSIHPSPKKEFIWAWIDRSTYNRIFIFFYFFIIIIFEIEGWNWELLAASRYSSQNLLWIRDVSYSPGEYRVGLYFFFNSISND